MTSSKRVVAPDMVVKLQYGITVDGKQLGTCDPEPIVYLHGHDQIIPGFEKAVEGLAVGDTATFEVQPEDGYGFREEAAKITMPKAEYPQELPLTLGAELQLVNEDGEEIPGWLTEIKEDEITVDFNHPLADKVLLFDVEILDIRPATREELDSQLVNDTDGEQ